MDLVHTVVLYLFATLTFIAVGYFWHSITKLKHIKDYKVMKHSKEGSFNALAALALILILWAVVHISLVALS